jgi:hypothetical protein
VFAQEFGYLIKIGRDENVVKKINVDYVQDRAGAALLGKRRAGT